MQIEIEWLYDDHDCETCGSQWSHGAKVHLDGKLLIDNQPKASCFECAHWDEADIYKEVLTKLGYTVVEDTNEL